MSCEFVPKGKLVVAKETMFLPKYESLLPWLLHEPFLRWLLYEPLLPWLLYEPLLRWLLYEPVRSRDFDI